jgi:hypothetical protein
MRNHARNAFQCLTIALGSTVMLGSMAIQATAGTNTDYEFDGSISLQVLQNYLSRAIQMGRLGEEPGDTTDNIRMLTNIGAKFAGRTIITYSKEDLLPQRLTSTRDIALRVHAADPDIILEGGIFEYVSTKVNTLPIPAYVFQAFGLPVVSRNFRQADMVFADNPVTKLKYLVPDITKIETRLWFYYLATSYIDIGIESIHWGYFEPQAYNDKPNYTNYYNLLAKVRLYAKTHARRHFVLNSADSNIPVAIGGKLLFDFGSNNLHANGVREVTEDPQKIELISKYSKSASGITPSGWSTTRLPFLVHIDNRGYSGKGGTSGLGGSWTWGWDEISWFANQPEESRNEFLRYADDYIDNMWPDNAGHLEMPGIRVITPAVKGTSNYFANARACYSFGFNQEESIRQIWQAKGTTPSPPPPSLPDVIVTSLSYTEATGIFTSVIKNQGNGAVPVGANNIGTRYSVDGVGKTWGSISGPLAAGSSVTTSNAVPANGGPYFIPNGTHSIEAWVDDFKRFAESDETNNKLKQTIAVGGSGSGLLPCTP